MLLTRRRNQRLRLVEGPALIAIDGARPREQDPEAALVAAAARGDPDAMRELYRAYLPRVYAYVSYRVSSVPDAEDVTSEAFLRVARELRRFRYRGEGSFAAWLFRIVNNLLADHHRRRRRSRPELSLEAASAVADASPPPGQALLEQEQVAEMRALIDTLPPQRQKVVLLRFFAGLRNREIARVLGLDERTVASHLSRAIQDLHQKYLSSQSQTETTVQESPDDGVQRLQSSMVPGSSKARKFGGSQVRPEETP